MTTDWEGSAWVFCIFKMGKIQKVLLQIYISAMYMTPHPHPHPASASEATLQDMGKSQHHLSTAIHTESS